ncbi:MAG TPA: DUF92 domain-containing protein [Promineifilum sp.]|nr:DUF92 domain-containing protein [Promineifilum sp.]HRQ12850.1 DUF92 domain-containing protein [Promineifilum sp.]
MSQSLLPPLALGLVLSLLIAFLAWRRDSLSQSGAVGALVVGTLIFGLGGWVWGVLLAVFFISSSLLSHFKEREKAAVAEKFEKGHRRDMGQVLANGGLGAVIALLSVVVPESAVPAGTWFFLFLGVMATVTADTWATELGTLSKGAPRLITNGRAVEVGTSGGVSPLGTGVSFAGGLLIGLTAGLLAPVSGLLPWSTALPVALIGALSGATGSLIDSLMGATIQQIYYCDTCAKETERRLHRCGTTTRPLRGWAWMHNDMVNLISSLGGGLVAMGLGVVLL